MSTEETPAKKPRRRLTPIVLIVLVNLLGLGAFLNHTFTAARLRANTRACFSNQRSIAGAIEMAHLDHNIKGNEQPLNADFIAFLINNGYLRSEPHDVGTSQRGAWKHFVRDPNTPSGIRCVVHGAVPDFKDKNAPTPAPIVPPPLVKTPPRGLIFKAQHAAQMDQERADKMHADALALGEP